MTTSERAFVWTWLPGSTVPVVAGVVEEVGERHRFAYAQSYLRNPKAINLFGPEVDLGRGAQWPAPHLRIHGFLRDALPDGWGQRVIDTSQGRQQHSEIEYMILSGSSRFGAIDFQSRPDVYETRENSAGLDDLHSSAQLLEEGHALPPALESALLHGTSIGGARPKATIVDEHGIEYIAKFSSQSDTMPMVQAEAVAMTLAQSAGLRAADISLTESLGKTVLLVRRFDRTPEGGRTHAASILTLMKERPEDGRFISYPEVVRVLRRYSHTPASVGPEIFERIAFNIAVGNTDDHAKNHAVLWNGENMELSPAFDIAPQPRSGMTAAQAMSLGECFGSTRASSFAALLGESALYDLDRRAALEVIDRIITAIEDGFDEAADFARLTQAQRRNLRGGVSGQFLNEGTLIDLPRKL